MQALRAARCRVPADLESISTTAQEAPAGSVGVEPQQVDRIWRAVERLYKTGLYPAINLCIRRRGQVLINRSIGHARGNGPQDPPGTDSVVVRPDTPMCVFSISKAVTAMLVHHLDDKGLLHIDDAVCEYIPEFAQNGKRWVTLRHVLSHRAGIPSLGRQVDPGILFRWDEIVQRLCAVRPVSAPGRQLAYHAVTGGFVLGEVVARVTGKTVAEVLADEVLTPGGFDGMNYGWPEDRLDEVSRSYFTGPPVPFPVSSVAARALGVPFDQAPEIGNHPAWLTSIVPSGNIVATADELCRFMEILLRDGESDGKRIFAARTVRRARSETAYREMDLTFMFPVRYGTGLMLGGKVFSPFGPGTPRSFGHLGFINCFAWADPDRELSAALLTSGKPCVANHFVPLVRLLTRIARGVPVV